MTDKYINHYSLAIRLEGSWSPDNHIWLNANGKIVDSPIDYEGDGCDDCWEGFYGAKGYCNALRNLQWVADTHSCSATLIRYVDTDVEYLDEYGDPIEGEYLGNVELHLHSVEPTQEEDE